MENFWKWAFEHWFLFFVLVWVAAHAFSILASRTIRMVMIVVRGWPHNPLMDADGGHCFPQRLNKRG